MSTKQIEALKLALEALENAEYGDYDKKELNEAITAIREALDEPQEKYIYGTPLLDAMTGKANEALDKMAENARELGLDYGPIVERVENSVGMGHKAWDMVKPKELAKAFHEALAEQPAQEPVAWIEHGSDEVPSVVVWERGSSGHYTPLYTSSRPSKPWVGLSEEDRVAINQSCLTKMQAAASTEAILREKNNG